MTPSATTRRPRPTRRLLERDGERSAIGDVLTSAAEGVGGSISIEGPAGIGKTRLIDEARGLRVLAATGGELEREFSYGLVRQLLERELHALPAARRRRVLARAAAPAAHLFGLATSPTRAPSGPEAAFARVHALYWVVVNLTARTPLALVVDDLHWSDAASMRVLGYLARRIDELPVALVTARRPSGNVQDRTVESIRAEGTIVLAPRPLSRQGVERLVSAAVEGPTEALLIACFEATGGNPYLCESVVSVLGEVSSGDDDPADLVERVVQVRGEAVARRLGGLTRDAAALARATAVLGSRADLRHAAGLARLDLDAATAAASSLAAAGVLLPGLPLEFDHALVREATRAIMSGAELALLHGRAARLLARDGAPVERVAPHLLLSEPGSRPWVVETLSAAATNAAGAGDARAASVYLRRALREPPEADRRRDILRRLGIAELEAGEPEAAAEHLEQAWRQETEAVLRAALGRDLGAALAAPGRYGAAVAVLEASIDGLPAGRESVGLELIADLHQAAMMSPDLYEVAVARVASVEQDVPGDTVGERALLATLATEGCLAGESAERVRVLAGRAFAGGLLHDQGLHSPLWGNAAFPLLFADGFAEIRPVVEEAIGAARDRGSLVGTVRAHAVRAMLAMRTGAISAAAADARTAVDLSAEHGLAIGAIAVGTLVEALVERGEHEPADHLLSELGRTGPLAPGFLENWVLHGRGVLRLAQGRLEDAVSDLEELGRRGDAWRPWNPGIFGYRSTLALAYFRLGREQDAREMAAEGVERARRWAAPRAVGIALRTCGLVTGGPAGIEQIAESVGVLTDSGARLEHARSLVDLGAATRRAGRRTEARESLFAGMELAVRCGAPPLADRAREELVATGARPRRAHRTGAEALTPSEVRVARLAAEGLTNREIAQTLFVTLRTVQVHLTGSYRKLGITSRTQLPGALGGRDG